MLEEPAKIGSRAEISAPGNLVELQIGLLQ
jgi:hypothetical protein